jgi:uncharacterized protein (DUF983 family)
MADGKHCPACGTDIGIWPVFSAGLPNLIRCPRCKVRLGYQGIGAVLAVLLLVLGAVLAVAYVVAGSFQSNYRFFAFLVIVLGAWIPVELVVVFYLRTNKTLESRSGGAPPAKQGD